MSTVPTPASRGIDIDDAVTRRNARCSLRALAVAVFVVLGVLAGAAVAVLRANAANNGFLAWFTLTVPLGAVAVFYARRAEAAVVDEDGPLPDERRARLARRVGVAGLVLATMLMIGLAIWGSRKGIVDVGNTFFSWTAFKASFPLVWSGFKLNVAIFLTAEVLVLLWGLAIASVRQLPGRAAAPLRWLTIAYVDVFRGLPALVTIYLVGFGLSLTHLPFISDPQIHFLFIQFDQVESLGILAITLVYSAYVAEVYRAGIESIHWSQSAAARGLGLSRGQAMRFVILPQAVRRVIPPLMNDFIGLQKDTALLSVLAVNEGFNLARIYAGNHFNLSSVTLLGLMFLVVTIPLTRVTDVLVRRDRRRMHAGAT